MTCQNCEVQIDGSYGSGRFCSFHCARGFSTKSRRIEINKLLSLKMSLKDNYCCVTCTVNFRTSSELRKHRKSFEHTKNCENHRPVFNQLKTDATRKRWLIKERGNKCENCLISKWEGMPAPIQLDHISGNVDDSRKENLRLLCANCHALTPTYAGRNIRRFPNTRHSIFRKRYYDHKTHANGVKETSDPPKVVDPGSSPG